MSETVRAVYENGVLRPLSPLNLRERQTVRVQVLPDDVSRDEGMEAVRVLVSAGLMRHIERAPLPPDPVSERDRRALAERLARAPGKPLSEVIIEDRGER
ncbi:MAG TPA: antitoxin family protein [Anaerolineae bacterium]|nr:antitoxin family protein [Anaerolineae bacterium]